MGFNLDIGTITQYIDVNAESHRYSIETQVSDLLDSMLSKYPISERNRSVLNNIHLTIDRFKQLRENYSTFDEYNNITGPIVYGANYKPLEEYFDKFDKKLFWILPVVKNIKKLYFENVTLETTQSIIEIDEIRSEEHTSELQSH